jgi:hypothetical protein
VVILPFLPPRAWTLGSVRQAIGAALEQLAAAAGAPDQGGAEMSCDVWVGTLPLTRRGSGRRNAHDAKRGFLTVWYEAARSRWSYVAEVQLAGDDATRALEDWCRVLFPGGHTCFSSVADLDERLRRAGVSTPTDDCQQPGGPAEAAATESDDNEADDELDPLERIARRTLHGSRAQAWTPSAAADLPAPDPRLAEFDRLLQALRRIAAASPVGLPNLESFVREYLQAMRPDVADNVRPPAKAGSGWPGAHEYRLVVARRCSGPRRTFWRTCADSYRSCWSGELEDLRSEACRHLTAYLHDRSIPVPEDVPWSFDVALMSAKSARVRARRGDHRVELLIPSRWAPAWVGGGR